MLDALRDGFRAVRRSPGLAPLLLAVNLGVAALLALPLASRLEHDLENTAAASGMMYDFDYSWWSRWSDAQSGWTKALGPEILGVGFAFRNLDLLLRGELPARLFAHGDALVDPVILAVGLLYLIVQTFLAGGVLGVLRGAQGSWTLRGLLHGSGFYFGRFLRLMLLALAAAWVLFRLNAFLAPWVDERAAEAVSERTALVFLLGRNALLLLALLFLHMVSSVAKVIVVLEERSSAVLALLSSLAFCLANLRRAAGQYVVVLALGVAAVALWGAADGAWQTVGYRSQLVTLLLAEVLVLARIALRLALLGSQLSLYRRFS
jgi:hypothetical protein